jgi:hypothetical protein
MPGAFHLGSRRAETATIAAIRDEIAVIAIDAAGASVRQTASTGIQAHVVTVNRGVQ